MKYSGSPNLLNNIVDSIEECALCGRQLFIWSRKYIMFKSENKQMMDAGFRDISNDYLFINELINNLRSIYFPVRLSAKNKRRLPQIKLFKPIYEHRFNSYSRSKLFFRLVSSIKDLSRFVFFQKCPIPVFLIHYTFRLLPRKIHVIFAAKKVSRDSISFINA